MKWVCEREYLLCKTMLLVISKRKCGGELSDDESKKYSDVYANDGTEG